MTALDEPIHRKSTALHQQSTFKRWVVHIDETYLKPIFGGRKRRVHELSIDNPEFDHHYQQYQEKEMKKAVSTTRLWASAGPTLGGNGSYGGMHHSPTGTIGVSDMNRSPQTHTNHDGSRYGKYDVVRTVGQQNGSTNSPRSNLNNTLSHRSPRNTNASNQHSLHRSPYTQSLPIHEHMNNGDNAPEETHESNDEISTDDDMRSHIQANQSDLASSVYMHDQDAFHGNNQ